MKYSAEYDARLDSYLAENAAKRKTLKAAGQKEVHAYTLEDYGLNREMVEKEFAAYISEYKLKDMKNK